MLRMLKFSRLGVVSRRGLLEVLGSGGCLGLLGVGLYVVTRLWAILGRLTLVLTLSRDLSDVVWKGGGLRMSLLRGGLGSRRVVPTGRGLEVVIAAYARLGLVVGTLGVPMGSGRTLCLGVEGRAA